LPIQHARTHASAFRYKVEPYVIAADIYGNPQHTGRGGWTWYTGSAGWMYRAGLESILGFQIQGDYLHIHPCIPKSWPGYDITYRYRSSVYHITIDNRSGQGKGVSQLSCDAQPVDIAQGILLVDDGQRHHVLAVLDISGLDSPEERTNNIV
jgi:cyclic beta-1,2-glucan synthetase